MPISSTTLASISEQIKIKHPIIESWFQNKESDVQLPLYTSVDVRDSGFKAAIVDTNLFPAGFNNLSQTFKKSALPQLQKAILKLAPNAKELLIIAEEHTRNTWYLENVWILQNMIRDAGFEVRVATFFDDQPYDCELGPYIPLETASGNTLKLYCLKGILHAINDGTSVIDLVILNNDLTTGEPDFLKQFSVPVVPDSRLGWHSRRKSIHFDKANGLITELCQLIDIDPWLLSLKFSVLDQKDITNEADRLALATEAELLFKQITDAYHTHGITEKPLIFLKSDSGTYGMGVLAVEHPSDILSLNRKERNKMTKGKSSQTISHFLLQEGVPSALQISDQTAELCLYQIQNACIGGFYRLNSAKNNRDNLNSSGMGFKELTEFPPLYPLYTALARVHALATAHELPGGKA